MSIPLNYALLLEKRKFANAPMVLVAVKNAKQMENGVSAIVGLLLVKLEKSKTLLVTAPPA